MNLAKRVVLGTILLWSILLSACGNSSTTNSANTLNTIYTAAAQTIAAEQVTNAQSATDQNTTPIPVNTDSALSTANTEIPTSTTVPTLALIFSSPTSYTTTGTSCDGSAYISDATIPDGTVMSPGQTFVKTWTLQNTGSCTWDTNFTMRFFSGDQMSGGNGTVSSSVAPGGQGNVSVTLTAPLTAGTYTGNWRLADDSGITFGEIVDVVIDVGESVTATYALTDTPAYTETPADTPTATPITPTTAVTAAPTSVSTIVPTTAVPTSVPTTAVPTIVPTTVPTTAVPTSVPTTAVPNTPVPTSSTPSH